MGLRSPAAIRGSRTAGRVGVALASVLVLASLSTFSAREARAAVNLTPVGFTCGYDVDTNTLTPTATIQRFGAESIDLRAAVGFRLFDQADLVTQLGQLGSGVTSDDAQLHGAFPVPIGGTEVFTPELASFGDGVGSPPLLLNHTYVINLALTDWSQELGGTDFGLAPGGVCTTSATCVSTTPVQVVSAGLAVGGNPTADENNGCWQWLRAPDKVKSPVTKKVLEWGPKPTRTCMTGSIEGTRFWTFDEARGTETPAADQDKIAQCANATGVNGYVYAAPNLWAAYSLNPNSALADRQAATRDHTSAPPVDAVFLETYTSTDPHVASWYQEWKASWQGLGYSAMINEGAPGSDTAVADLVYDLCVESLDTGQPLGVWATTEPKKRLSTKAARSRHTAIVEALNICTTGG